MHSGFSSLRYNQTHFALELVSKTASSMYLLNVSRIVSLDCEQ
jgi:hypothetical protein